MLGVGGTVLDEADRTRLLHPLVGGVILFARNYESPGQLSRLTGDIRALRDPALVIAVDHEGGRVQRFQNGFTAIPPMRTLGEMWDADADAAAAEARRLGYVIAAELAACGVDLSFTPVLDLDYGESTVIGNRAFHRNPRAVAWLAGELCEGLADAGMAAVGKHFPGHGYVRADSHTEVPVDERALAEIEHDDLIPFAVLAHSHLAGVMPAHVVYPAVDTLPAGYSRVWLQEILRGRLGFAGAVFSDDLGMVGAHGAGDTVARADAAIRAGCDIVLTCNDCPAADDLLARWRPPTSPVLAARWRRMERRAPDASSG